jgi:hypothetical protein
VASNSDPSKQADLLVEALRQLSADEILAFEEILLDLIDKAYNATLWDAADIIGCGCGDSGFVDFRAWLISRGKKVFEDALIDPESLVDLVDIHEDSQAGYVLDVAFIAYEQKTGKEMPIKKRKLPHLRGSFAEEKEIKSRFPKLAAKFGDCEQRTKQRLIDR